MTALASGRWLRLDRRAALYLYTGVEIAAGSLALAWAVVSCPLTPAISFTGDDRPLALLLGLAFWVAFGLFGGTRVGSIHGFGVLTFHLPFMLAAAALGGPAAGGAVAFLSATELRELREVPWYGMLANHASFALGGVVSGLVIVAADDRLGLLGLGPEPTALLAFVLGAAAFVLITNVLSAATATLRDPSGLGEVVAAFTGTFRTTIVTEVVVGWLLALTYRMVGWWAAVVAVIIVLQLMRQLGEDAYVEDDPPTRLLDYGRFLQRTRAAADVRPLAYLVIRLEGWRSFVDARGHEAAEALATSVGRAIAGAMFVRDEATRSPEGDWHVLLLRDGLGGTVKAARKQYTAVSAVVASVGAGAFIAARIGGGVTEERGVHLRGPADLAEQALFRAQRERMAIAIKTENGWYSDDPP